MRSISHKRPSYPYGHEQANPSGILDIQVPPFKHLTVEHAVFDSFSHLFPVYPALQKQDGLVRSDKFGK